MTTGICTALLQSAAKPPQTSGSERHEPGSDQEQEKGWGLLRRAQTDAWVKALLPKEHPRHGTAWGGGGGPGGGPGGPGSPGAGPGAEREASETLHRQRPPHRPVRRVFPNRCQLGRLK